MPFPDKLPGKNPLVTVLMPVYNAEAYVGEAVTSILAQTLTDFELLIMNDGSTDGSVSVTESFSDPRIRLVHNPENMKLVATLNRGLELARGTYIARMDADDIAHPRRLENQVAFMTANPELDILGTAIEFFGNRTAPWTHYYPETHDAIRAGLLFYCTLGHPTVMLRRAFLERHRLRYNPEYAHAEDYDLWERAVRVGRAANLQAPLHRYRVHSSQVGQSYQAYQEGNSRRVRERLLAAIGIIPSQRQSDLHDQLTYGRWDRQPKKLRHLIPEILRWFDLILQRNRESQILDQYALREVLRGKWLLARQEMPWLLGHYADWHYRRSLLDDRQSNACLPLLPATTTPPVMVQSLAADEAQRALDKTVSIIMRTIDGRLSHLEKALASVAGNTYPHKEVIVVYQGMNADYFRSLDALSQSYPGLAVRCLQNPATHDERARNLNLGIREARGRYLAFLDDDDLLYANHFSLLIDALEHSEAAWGYAQVCLSKWQGDEEVSRDYPFYRESFSFKDIWRENFIPIHSFVVDRLRLARPELLTFNEQLTRSEDYCFLLNLAFHHEPVRLDNVTCEYRVRLDGDNSNVSLMSGTALNDEELERKRQQWRQADEMLRQARAELARRIYWFNEFAADLRYPDQISELERELLQARHAAGKPLIQIKTNLNKRFRLKFSINLAKREPGA